MNLYQIGSLIVLIGSWLFYSTINWALAIKTDYPNKQLAWVPVANMWIYGKTVRFSNPLAVGMMFPFIASILSLFAPGNPVTVILDLVGIVVLLIATVRLFRCFGTSPANIWWVLLPIVGTIIFLVKFFGLLFSKNVPYTDLYAKNSADKKGVLTATPEWNALSTALALAIVAIIIIIVGSFFTTAASMQQAFEAAAHSSLYK